MPAPAERGLIGQALPRTPRSGRQLNVEIPRGVICSNRRDTGVPIPDRHLLRGSIALVAALGPRRGAPPRRSPSHTDLASKQIALEAISVETSGVRSAAWPRLGT